MKNRTMGNRHTVREHCGRINWIQRDQNDVFMARIARDLLVWLYPDHLSTAAVGNDIRKAFVREV